jgi:hypothetical protein
MNEVVRVTGRRGTIEIPWDSRQALLTRLRGDDDAMGIIDAFEGSGTSRLVELEPADARLLLLEIEAWSDELGSVARLPEGLYELRNALHERARQKGRGLDSVSARSVGCGVVLSTGLAASPTTDGNACGSPSFGKRSEERPVPVIWRRAPPSFGLGESPACSRRYYGHGYTEAWDR